MMTNISYFILMIMIMSHLILLLMMMIESHLIGILTIEMTSAAHFPTHRAPLETQKVNFPCFVSSISIISKECSSGTMLSHDSMTYAARQNMALFGMEYSKETTVSYLPQVAVLR